MMTICCHDRLHQTAQFARLCDAQFFYLFLWGAVYLAYQALILTGQTACPGSSPQGISSVNF